VEMIFSSICVPSRSYEHLCYYRIEFYTESIDKSGRHDLEVGSLSNIATAYFRSRQYDKSEKYYREALDAADKAGKEFVGTKALVMKKLAYVTYKRKMYLDAFELYNQGKLFISIYTAPVYHSLSHYLYQPHLYLHPIQTNLFNARVMLSTAEYS
jgi:tetratricopeptide (TPR) repeat protein